MPVLAAVFSVGMFVLGLLTQAWGMLSLVWIVVIAVWGYRYRVPLGTLWLLRISRAEFGQSDVQANYTRTYAWMANQLGHMTLGLGTALAYIWLVEGLGAMAADLTGEESARTTALVAIALMIGTILIIWKMLAGLANSPMDVAEGAPARFAEMATPVRIFTGLLMLGSLMVVWPNVFGLGEIAGPGARVYTPQRIEDILTGFGAAFVSLALWGTKEFGNDQRGVRVALARAAWLRGTVCPGQRTANLLKVEAIWDSIADGFFYITGATLAVGVISSQPDMDTSFAESAWEITAVVFFGGVMLLVGQRYAYRSRAIDLIGAPYAFRLGLVESDVTVTKNEALLAGGTGCLVDKLCDYVSIPPGEGVRPFHIVVYGAPGSGKTPFVVAMACEAAMARIPFDLRNRDIDPESVRVRYTTYRDARFDEDEDPIAKRNYFRTGIKDPVFIDGELLWNLRMANVVVVDNIPLGALLDGEGRFTPSAPMQRLIAALTEGNRRVIWAIDPPKAELGPIPGAYDSAVMGEVAGRFADLLGVRTDVKRQVAADGPAGTEVACIEIRDNAERRAEMMRKLEAVRAPDAA